MKYLILLLALSVSAECRENICWPRLLNALAIQESSGGKRMWNKKELASGWYQMRPLALRDANEYLGTNYRLKDLYDRRIANRTFMSYCHKYRSRWNSLEDLIQLWHLGPNWKNRLDLDKGYLEKVNSLYKESNYGLM